jgi:tetratricopeptide (TPR) repeat protein
MKIRLWLALVRAILFGAWLIGVTQRAVLRYWHAFAVLLVGAGIVLAGTMVNWLWIVLVSFALVMLAAGILVARTRTIVEEFIDYEANEQNTIAPGVSTLLAVELARLGDLYRTVDDQRPIASVAGTAVDVHASIGVGNWTKDLESAISTELKVKVGPLQVPVGVFLTLLGRLVRGPRIAGGLHDENGIRILTARLLSSERGFTWRVQLRASEDSMDEVASDDSADELASGESVDELVKELACRIFTDLSLGREVSWEATEAFTNGLSAYRKCLRATGDRPAELREAERWFIKASAADESFDLAYYNLGVVYEELDMATEAAADEVAEMVDGGRTHHRRAKAAFKKAILKNPERLEAYYALALLSFRDADPDDPRKRHDAYRSTLELCERIIGSGGDTVLVAHALNLKGLTEPLLDSGESRSASLRTRRLAVRKAVRACVSSELKSLPRSQPRLARQRRRLLSDSLRNLGVDHAFCALELTDQARQSAFRDAERLLHAAIAYAPSLADRHYALGKLLAEQGRYAEAVGQFHAALRLAPGERRYWANVASAAAGNGDREEAERAVKHAMRSPWEGQRELFQQVTRAYRRLGEDAEADRVRSLVGYRKQIKEGRDLSSLEGELEGAADRAWERGQAYILAARRRESESPTDAARCLASAIETLNNGHREEVRRRRLRAKRAGLLLRMGEPVKALAEAQKALDEDPLDGHVRAALGEAYFALGEFSVARQAWQDALAQNPEQSEWRIAIGATFLAEAWYTHDPSECSGLLDSAAKRAHQDLRSFSTLGARAKGGAHRLLGLVHLHRGEYHLAVARLRIAADLQEDVRPGTRYWLGRAHFHNRAPYDAAVEFEKALELTREGDRSEIVDYRPEPTTRAEFRVRVLLALALALRDQERPDDDPKDYSEKVAEARIEIDAALASEAFTAETGAVLKAMCFETEGWIAFKSGDHEQAIKNIERALSRHAEPLAYLHLATVYGARLRHEEGERVAASLLGDLQRAVRRARDLDPFGQFTREIEQLLGDFEAVAPTNGEAPAAHQTTSVP